MNLLLFSISITLSLFWGLCNQVWYLARHTVCEQWCNLPERSYPVLCRQLDEGQFTSIQLGTKWASGYLWFFPENQGSQMRSWGVNITSPKLYFCLPGTKRLLQSLPWFLDCVHLDLNSITEFLNRKNLQVLGLLLCFSFLPPSLALGYTSPRCTGRLTLEFLFSLVLEIAESSASFSLALRCHPLCSFSGTWSRPASWHLPEEKCAE